MEKLTLKSVKVQLVALNVSITKRDGEYRVRLSEDVKPFDSNGGYFTPDLQDALDTGRNMRSQKLFEINFNEI